MGGRGQPPPATTPVNLCSHPGKREWDREDISNPSSQHLLPGTEIRPLKFCTTSSPTAANIPACCLCSFQAVTCPQQTSLHKPLLSACHVEAPRSCKMRWPQPERRWMQILLQNPHKMGQLQERRERKRERRGCGDLCWFICVSSLCTPSSGEREKPCSTEQTAQWGAGRTMMGRKSKKTGKRCCKGEGRSHPARKLHSGSLGRQQESKVQHPLQQGPGRTSPCICAPPT